MSISYIDLKWPKIAPPQVEGRMRKTSLKIPVVLDLSSLFQGASKDVEFTLAPGSVAADVRQIACATVEQAGFDPASADLQWRDGIVWKPFETLEEASPERLRTKWMLKTSKDPHALWPRIQGLEAVANEELRGHWKLRGAERLPDREVSAWNQFLASYTKGGPSDATTKANAAMMALTSKETESAAVEGGMPLPRGLATKAGRRKAATLLATTQGLTLRLRFLLKPGLEQSFGMFGVSSDMQASGVGSGVATNVASLRDPFGDFGLGSPQLSQSGQSRSTLPGIGASGQQYDRKSDSRLSS
jgi:hypothetical protein